ncbi:Transketolase [Fusarium sp. Ph1]|nr:Transketolase [Fusarium sp. Ph1]
MVEDGNIDLATIEAAIQQCKEETTRPSIIKLRTTIGYGSLEEGTHGVHGNPLKADDIKQLKSKWGFNANEAFHVPEEVYQAYQNRAAEGLAAKQAWESLLAKCADQFPELHADLQRRPTSTLPQGWEASPPSFSPSDPAVATQKLSETILSKIHAIVPELIGGSSDLRPSNLTRWASAVDFQAPGLEDIPGDYLGRYLRYGVREYALGAIMNGLAAYGTVLPYGGTFLNFVSYAAGAVRLSALSRIRVIWVATHDSIALGQDEPTHQPIETLVHFRTMPNCSVWRPADGNETSATYLVSLKSMSTPSILALSRQNLPQLRGSSVEKASRGGYVVSEPDSSADITLVGTGSEAHVVSLPCWEVFDAQSEDYKRSVLGSGVPSLSVKALSTVGWQRWTHQQFGIDTFGASAPADVLFAKFEFSKEGVAKHAISTIEFFKKKSQSIGSPLGRAF